MPDGKQNSTDLLKTWIDNIPYGDGDIDHPPERFTRLFHRKQVRDESPSPFKNLREQLRKAFNEPGPFENLPKDIQRKIMKEHPFDKGMEMYSVQIEKEAFTAVVVDNAPQNADEIIYIEGYQPNPDNPSDYYDWQKGLKNVEGYYIYNHRKNELQSIVKLIQDILIELTPELSPPRIQLFFYAEGQKEHTERVLHLTDQNGEKYYAVCARNPETLEDLLSLAHELGHIIAEEKVGEHYDAEVNDEGYIAAWEKAVNTLYSKVETYEGSQLPDKEKDKLHDEFYHSEGYLKSMDIEMIWEVDAWSAALEVLDRLSVKHLFEDGTEDLINYIISNVKTRSPDTLRKKNPLTPSKEV
jgi:hypothetical protein